MFVFLTWLRFYILLVPMGRKQNRSNLYLVSKRVIKHNLNMCALLRLDPRYPSPQGLLRVHGPWAKRSCGRKGVMAVAVSRPRFTIWGSASKGGWIFTTQTPARGNWASRRERLRQLRSDLGLIPSACGWDLPLRHRLSTEVWMVVQVVNCVCNFLYPKNWKVGDTIQVSKQAWVELFPFTDVLGQSRACMCMYVLGSTIRSELAKWSKEITCFFLLDIDL